MGQKTGAVVGALTGLAALCGGGYVLDRGPELYDQTKIHVVDHPRGYVQDVSVLGPLSDAAHAYKERDFDHIDDNLSRIDVRASRTPLHDRHMGEKDWELSTGLYDHCTDFVSNHWKGITGATGLGLALLLGTAITGRRNV